MFGKLLQIAAPTIASAIAELIKEFYPKIESVVRNKVMQTADKLKTRAGSTLSICASLE